MQFDELIRLASEQRDKYFQRIKAAEDEVEALQIKLEDLEEKQCEAMAEEDEHTYISIGLDLPKLKEKIDFHEKRLEEFREAPYNVDETLREQIIASHNEADEAAVNAIYEVLEGFAPQLQEVAEASLSRRTRASSALSHDPAHTGRLQTRSMDIATKLIDIWRKNEKR